MLIPICGERLPVKLAVRVVSARGLPVMNKVRMMNLAVLLIKLCFKYCRGSCFINWYAIWTVFSWPFWVFRLGMKTMDFSLNRAYKHELLDNICVCLLKILCIEWCIRLCWGNKTIFDRSFTRIFIKFARNKWTEHSASHCHVQIVKPLPWYSYIHCYFCSFIILKIYII